MYTAFYGLREKPFSLTPDPRFLFLATSHREALAHILYGIDQGEGFICITGEVGTGKTTMCRTLLQRLGKDTEVAFVFNPTLSGVELLRAIGVELGLDVEGRSRAELSDLLNEFLLETNRAGRRVLLIIDEAQNLSNDVLEEIRLFSNLETPTSKLIQILLFGQPELDEKLETRELRQLRQRISVRWSLSALSQAETREYVSHRMTIAAGYQSEFFSDAALRQVFKHSGGVPRLINVLCDRSLLAGYADGSRQIGSEHVKEVAREIRGGSRSRSRWWIPAAATACIALLGFATWRLLDTQSIVAAIASATASIVPAVSETALPQVGAGPRHEVSYGEAALTSEEGIVSTSEEGVRVTSEDRLRVTSEDGVRYEIDANISTFAVGGEAPR